MRKKHNSSSSLWRLGLPLMLWIIAGIISLVPAVNKSVAIIELIRMLRVFLIFVAVYNLVDKPEDVRIIVVSLVIAFAIQTALISMEYYAGHPIFRLPGGDREADIVGTIFRPSGSMEHSSNFGKLASLSLPLCFAYLFIARKKIWQIFFGLSLIGGLIALILTLSRAGIGASMLGLGWMVLIMWHSMRLYKTRIFVLILLLIVGLGVAFHIGGERLKLRVMHDYGSAALRLPQYSIALNIIKSNPLVGVGLNNYGLVTHEYDRTIEQISKIIPGPVHNIYLLYAAEMGVHGLAYFCWFLVSTIALAFKKSSQATLLVDSIIIKAIGVGIFSLWLIGLVDWGFRAIHIHTSYLAVFAGVLAALKFADKH